MGICNTTRPLMPLTLLCAALTLALPQAVQARDKTYAQSLVERQFARHPGLQLLEIHATPPKGAGPVVIASTSSRLGTPSGPDDVLVMETGKTVSRTSARGDVHESRLMLQDVSGDPVGSLRVAFAKKAGGDAAALDLQAVAIRNAMRRQIMNVPNLVDPYPYVANAVSCPYAQKLVDSTMTAHPELLVLVMHVAPPGVGDDYPIIASSIGRHGKRADGDDMQVINVGKPLSGAFGAQKTRYGIEVVMRDQAGKLLGALSSGYAFRQGDDEQALLKAAAALELEMRAKIPSLAVLCGPEK
ncbi:MAG: TonB-dependent siderophore receptor [Massilia sp.]|nr:TonB-dependent siderophore receptor [Massilia sp.]MDB5950445.1 TonB-dependent siderophore receptor [Massilia sp.]